jgi:hypothetical protein
VYYTELGGNGFGASDAIHIASFNGGAVGADIGTIPNPRPGFGIQDLNFANGALYALTGYFSAGPLQVFKLDPTTGAVLGGPVTITGPAGTSPFQSDGFTVLPNGNFLINYGNGETHYREYSSVTGALVGGGLDFVLGGRAIVSTGVDTDGKNLYFAVNFNSFTKTDLAGNFISNSPVSGFNQFEDISLIKQIPEPTTVLLLGAGLVGLAGYGQRRGKRA